MEIEQGTVIEGWYNIVGMLDDRLKEHDYNRKALMNKIL